MGKSFGIFIGIIGLLVFSSSIFFVQEYEKAILFKFGEITDTDFEPGIHFKIPFINNVKKYDARIQTLDAAPQLFLTSEKKNLVVDSFVVWRIKNLKTFYTAVLGENAIAESRLDQIVKDQMRSEFSKRTIHQVVSEHRDELMGLIKEGMMRNPAVKPVIDLDQATSTEPAAATPVVSEEVVERESLQNIEDLLGIEIVDIRLKRVDFPPQINESVYSRMRAERERIAKELRAQGSEEAEKIQAKADRDRTVILAKAYRDAEIIRGEGDALAADTYAQAFGKNQEFYALYRSLNAYKKVFSQKSDMIVLQPDSEFFKYFNKKGRAPE